MPVAIRAITRIQDADDINVSLGVGVDEYALTWDNDTARFVLRAVAAGVTDHGALTGLTPDDDHAQYALLAGRTGGQTLYGGDAANDDITIHGTSNATRTTSYVILQPTAGNVGIGTASPSALLDVAGAIKATSVAISTMTLGSVTYIGADGLITQNNSQLFWDATNLRFGFGTMSDDLNEANGKLVVSGTKGVASGGAPTKHLWINDSAAYTVADRGGSITFGAFYNATQQTSIAAIEARVQTGATDPYDGSLVFLTRRSATSPGTTVKLTIKPSGNVGIGTTAPGSLLHALLTSSATNAVTDVLIIGHDTSGTAAAGFGAGQFYHLETSTTAAQAAARIKALWYEATHATRKADLVLTAYDTAEREGLRIRGNGSEPAIGFYGVAPIARAILATGVGATVDNVITALQNLGLVKQS